MIMMGVENAMIMVGQTLALTAAAEAEAPDYGWVLIIGAGFLLGLAAFLFAFKSAKKMRFIRNIPTSKTTGVFIGLVEVRGTAESKNPLTSPLAEKPCVHFSSKVEEHWTRRKTVTERDRSGSIRTRVKTESGWDTIWEQRSFIKFYVRDDYGVIRVKPDSADIKSTRALRKTVKRDDPLYFAKGPGAEVNGSDGRRRFTEDVIEHRCPVYVIGQARERRDKIEPEIAFDKSAPLFVISSWTEKQVGRDFALDFWLLTAAGWLLSLGGWAVKDLGYDIPLKDDLKSFLIITAAYFGLWILRWIGLVYNDMVGLRNSVRQAWSNVDVQLARRRDLIPNLVSAVKGFKEHEADLQELLAQLRSQAEASGSGGGDAALRRLGPRLSAVIEAYPALKSDDVFLELQRQLSDTETRVALARAYYNDIATSYNTRLQSLPDGLIARLGFLKSARLLEAQGFERPAAEIEAAPPGESS